jgi:photosystem II stability/assembly factor-like uncharacterized protein
MLRRLAVVLPLALAALPGSGHAAWQALGGPPGGDVRALATDPRDPRTLYLGTPDGLLYRSDDGGASWRRPAPGFPLRGMSLDEIVVLPTGVLLVGYWEVGGSGGGVARSTDGGRSFALLEGIAGESVRSLAVAASDPASIVAGAIGGVFRSTDAGATWRRISPPGDRDLRNVGSLAVDPANPEVIYAGTWHLPWKSEDGGRTWRPAHAGIIDDSDIFTLTPDRRSPRTLFATACSGIYRSSDAGARWSRLRGIPTSARRTRAFAQDPERPDALYAGTTAGLWTSGDGGASWRRTTSPELVVNAIAALPGGLVLLGTDGAGVLRSTDGGASFGPANQGFAERFVSRLVFDAAGRRVLAAVSGDRFWSGVLAAPSPAGPWTRLGAGLEGREVLALAAAGREVLAGTDDGLFASAPPLERWSRLAVSVDGAELRPRVADLAALPGGVVVAATDRGLLRSADGGASWEGRTLGAARSVAAVASPAVRPQRVLAATALGVFRSEDAGASWSPVAGALPEGRLHGLAFLPGSDAAVLAATSRGLYKSPDAGASWYRRGGGLPFSDITGLAASSDGRVVWASDFSLGGLYRSDDAGETWRRETIAGLPGDRVWALAFDPAGGLLALPRSGGLHALTAGGGVVAAEP